MRKDKVFSEVYSVLQLLGEEYTSKIEENVMSIIENNRDMEYEPEIDRTKTLDEQNISRQAINIIAKIDMDFWSEKNEDKREIYTVLEKKEN